MFSKLIKPLIKTFKKSVALLCLSTFTIVNMAPIVLAASSFNKESYNTELVQNTKDHMNLGKRKKDNISNKLRGSRDCNSEDFIYVKDLNEISSYIGIKGINGVKQGAHMGQRAAVEDLPKYTFNQLSAMSYPNLMNALEGTSYKNISSMFKDTPEARVFYNDTARIKYMIDDLGKRGARFNGDDHQGIPTIAEVIRAGFFLGDNYGEDYPVIGTLEMKKLCIEPIKYILNNPNCRYGTLEQDQTIDAVGALIGNSTADTEIANKCTRFLKEFRLNAATYFKERSKSNAVHSIIQGIGYVFYGEIYDCWEIQPKDMPSFGKIDGFILELLEISNVKGLAHDDQWFVTNGVFYLGQLGKLYSNPGYIIRFLTGKMDKATKYSMDFFAAASQIDQNNDGINSRGEDIQYEQLQKEGNDYWMPKHYSFDNNTIIIHTGDKVSPEKVQRMYWATKEVESQFFRVYGNDKPLEPNNEDKVLTIRLFNSPLEYDLNSYLNDMPSDNGGMYIEPTGTFYTYERTTQESVYSLEELFRHEFTHYLQSKYQIPGMWGEGDFYKRGEIEWFDEATAEFFAGSTRTDGVNLRKAIIGYISSNVNERFTLSTLFNSSYADGNSKFYNYGWAYISYLYNNDIAKLMDLNNSIMSYNIGAFRNILHEQKNNHSREAAYQQHMVEVKANTNVGTPLVGDEYVQTHEKRTLAQIKNDIMNVSAINNFTEGRSNSPGFSTFKLEGLYRGSNSKGRTEDWKEMHAKANGMLKVLSTKGWTGYDTVTCYFTDYKVQNGAYQYNMVFRGLLNDGLVVVEPGNQKPIARINGTSTAMVDEYVYFTGEKSTDDDGSVNVFAWDFEDGTVSNEISPVHLFTRAGTFTVKLKVIDNEGAEDETQFKIVVTDNKVVVPENKTPIAVINGKSEAKLDEVISFTGSNSSDADGNIIEYAWSFEDGSISNKDNPTHAFTDSGTFTVILKVVDDKGAIDQTQFTVVVTEEEVEEPDNQTPIAIINANTEAEINEVVSFVGDKSTDADGEIVEYLWNFGDGSTSNDVNPKHAFKNSGIFAVTLKVTDDNGAVGNASLSVVITEEEVEEPDNQAPIAVINGKSEAKVDEVISFIGDKSSDADGTIKTFAWNFGDGHISDEINPTHAFGKAGIFTVILIVTDDKGAIAKAQVTVVITETEVIEPEEKPEVKPEIKPEIKLGIKPVTSPKTVDTSNIMLTFIMLISSLGMVIVLSRKNKLQRK